MAIYLGFTRKIIFRPHEIATAYKQECRKMNDEAN